MSKPTTITLPRCTESVTLAGAANRQHNIPRKPGWYQFELRSDLDTGHDNSAIAVVYRHRIVGHLPHTVAAWLSPLVQNIEREVFIPVITGQVLAISKQERGIHVFIPAQETAEKLVRA